MTVTDPSVAAGLKVRVMVTRPRAAAGSRGVNVTVKTSGVLAVVVASTVTLPIPGKAAPCARLPRSSVAWAETPPGPWMDSWAVPVGMPATQPPRWVAGAVLQFIWALSTCRSPIGQSSVPSCWPWLSKMGRGGMWTPKGMARTRSECAAVTAAGPMEVVPRAL